MSCWLDLGVVIDCKPNVHLEEDRFLVDFGVPFEFVVYSLLWLFDFVATFGNYLMLASCHLFSWKSVQNCWDKMLQNLESLSFFG